MTPMDHFALWQRTLADQADSLNPQREILRQAFLHFRERTAQLVGEIGVLLPQLTVHDITHLDALWRVADEIAGPDYPLNPAEAFVLGGAFLLHDAAHVLAAYEDGLAGIKGSIEWKDLIAQRFEDNEPTAGSQQERSALFQVLRHLHAKKAHQLAKMSWKVPSTGERIHLLEHFDLRDYYGDLIGEIAESHHWPAHSVAETFEQRHVNAPAFLVPARWTIDALKVAFLLRTVDASHIDGQRAPWFLFALRHPDGISQLHWQFQAKVGQPARTDRGELRLSSGSPFDTNSRQAWWLAYEAACMIDRELRDAQTLMRDARRKLFATGSVEHVASPEAFATNVRTAGWEPVNVAPKIGDVPKVIASLGGATLYGNRPELALRELIQNAADAVRALRALGEIGQKEGEIEVALTRGGDATWLHVTDTGVGMSRYVLTEVLLDFGNSFWSSESLRNELPGLASKGFKAIGRFGIGFFSVFMLGRKVVVTSRRFKRTSGENSDQWLLEFGDGLDGRPTLRRPSPAEELRRSGTKVSVAVDDNTLIKLLEGLRDPIGDLFASVFPTPTTAAARRAAVTERVNSVIFNVLVANLCPTLDIKVCVKVANRETEVVVNPDDWETMAPVTLLARVHPRYRDMDRQRLIDLRETSGFLAGRIGYRNGYLSRAITTHRGLQSGTVPRLVGVILGHNNMDLARSESLPVASHDAWKRWAEEWIDSAANDDVDALADLHPLCLGRDLPVYRFGGRQLTEAQLSEWLQAQSEVRVFDGLPEYDDYYNDEVSRQSFDRHFAPRDDILFLPSTDGTLAKALGFSKINYTERVEVALRTAWGEFEELYDDDECVGDVDGVDIIRSVARYARPETS